MLNSKNFNLCCVCVCCSQSGYSKKAWCVYLVFHWKIYKDKKNVGNHIVRFQRSHPTTTTTTVELSFKFVGKWTRQTGVVWLDIQLGDHTFVDDHWVALGAQSTQWWQINAQINGFSECSRWIGQHTYFAAGVVCLAPSRHHKCIVDRHAHNFRHTAALQLAGFVHIAGQMGLCKWNGTTVY